ncbi:MAG TPA: hypothetical protein VJX69_08685 [Terriglobales bacterium]|nr:hypothetical protein [Terriglobales bacterium]
MKPVRYSLPMFLAISMLCSLGAAQQSATTSSSATVPRLVNFSGKTADAQGKAISGIAGVTFAIYKDQNDGAPLWLETQNVQTDAKGNYTVQLGATKSDGLPLELFSSGEARWLGVRVNGGEEQPRVLLLSVPYALKAADAETVGGLPASAFMLAAPPASMSSTSIPAAAAPQPLATGTTPVTTAGGTVNKLAKFDASADITNSQVFDNGTNVGIGNTAPGAKLDVSGTGIFRGALSLPATGTSTSTAGKNSQPLNFTASAYNSSTLKPVNETFRWQAEPVGNNSATPVGKLNLLFGSGTATPTETGLSISNKGQITFASGQTFPSTVGTVKSVGLSAPSSDFTVSGSPVTTSGTLGLNWNVAPTSAATANAIVKRDSNGSFSAGAISATLGVTSLSPGIAVYGETSGGGGGADGVHGVAHGAGSGVTGLSDNPNGVGVWAQGPGYALYANGNTGQARTAGGWVKAMIFYSGYSGIIGYCFNSTLAGAAATTPPCGFFADKTGTGDYVFDFGFEVDDRFLSVTPMGWGAIAFMGVCSSFDTTCGHSLNANQTEVIFAEGGSFFDDYLYIFVY